MNRRMELLLAGLFFLSLGVVEAATPNLDLGPKPSFGLFQPRVTVDITDGAGGASFGPEASTFLLDTAANGIVIFPPATTELGDKGFRNEGTYEEAGVSGTSIFDVSAPYHLSFTGTDGVAQEMEDVRFMSASSPVDPTGLMGLNGIVGVSGMAGKVTTLDNRTREGAPSLGMGVSFGASVPSSGTHRFTIPFGKSVFPVEGETGPFPTWHEALPTVNLNAVSGDNTFSTPIVFDTGAQMTIISESMAHSLGLDVNGNGDFLDEAVATVPISGATGSVSAPVLVVERMGLPTDQGFELAWTSAEVIVLDIDPRIAGVLGADFITGDGGLDLSFLGGGGSTGGLTDLLGGLLGGGGGGLEDLLGGLGGLLGGGGGLDLDGLLGGGGGLDLGGLLGGGGGLDLDGLLGGGGGLDLDGLLGGGGIGLADDDDPTDPLGGLDLDDLLGGGGLGGFGGLLGGSDLFASFPLESVFDRVHIDLREDDGQLILDVNPTISASILNGDHRFDVLDVDDITNALGSSDGRYDLNDDGVVDMEDRDALIRDVFNSMPGDADLDQDVDFGDFLAVANGFGEDGGWGGGDFDGNGVTDFLDFLALAENFGDSSPAAAAVPEPVSGMLIVLGVVGLCSLRNRRQGRVDCDS